jgi:alkylation response protein AidB-like acyl-CoA dehydrogenase
MQIYDPPVADYRFLFEVFDYSGRVASLPGYEDYDVETALSLIEQCGKFAKEQMLPLNRVGDEQGVSLDPTTGAVTTPDGFAACYAALRQGGYQSLTAPVEHGGGGAPELLGAIFDELFIAANKSMAMILGLNHGLVEALHAHGADEQKKRFLPKIVSGEWSGTMCLTEPQCGTDLGLMTTKAVPEGDGYRLTGTKIWITYGDHDFTDNIVHLVLARLPDAPEGIKGISAFVVPKKLEDGSSNGVTCGGLEHKMGIHASPTCVINLEEAMGYLVGEPHKGMRSMFTMMNAARLMVGLEGIALSEIAYQTALAYAKDRRQSRSLNPAKNEPQANADNILVHPDVRRMLLNVKSTNVAMRGLAVFTGMMLDKSHKHPDEDERQRADDLLALLTPVVKSFCTERGFLNISEAMQVCGGSGYTKDWSIEQYLRDARIAMIYEGTNHIQALDLVGRKLPRHGGRLYQEIAKIMGERLESMEGDDEVKDLHADFKWATDILHETTMLLSVQGMQDPEWAAAVASTYLNMFGFVACAWVWVELAKAAEGKDDTFHSGKRKLARYYFKHVLPEISALQRIVTAGKEHIMAFVVDEL